MNDDSSKKLDPLFQLFERYLVTRSYENAGDFTRQLAEEYLLYLDSTPAHIPFEARSVALEDLASEVHEMLVTKLYGCVDPLEYENRGIVLKLEGGKKLQQVLPVFGGPAPEKEADKESD